MSVEQPSKPKLSAIDTTFVETADAYLDELSSLSERANDRQQFYKFLTQRLQILVGAVEAYVAVPGFQDQWAAVVRSIDLPSPCRIPSEEFEAVITSEQTCTIRIEGSKSHVLAARIAGDEEPKCLCVAFDHQPEESWDRIFKDMIWAAADVAVGFEQRQLLKQQDDRFAKLEAFVQLVKNSQKSLDLEKTGFHLASDCRHFLSADRIWIFTKHGRVKLLACSNVANVNERSRSFVSLQSAVREADSMATRDVIVHDHAECPSTLNKLASYLESDDVDGFYMSQLCNSDSGKVVGYFVAEYLRPHDVVKCVPAMKNLLPIIQSAIANSHTHTNLPLRRSMYGLGRLIDQFRLNALPRTLTVLMSLATLLIALLLIKVDFKVSVTGELRPSIERNVFSPADSIVDTVLVEYGSKVTQGQPLMQLVSSEYEVRLKELQNQLSSGRKELEANELLQATSGSNQDPLFAGQLAAKIEQNRLHIESTQKNVDWYLKRQQELLITAPINGVVISRDLRMKLMKRPISIGSRVLSIADTESDWEIEFDVPDREFGYMLEAKRGEQIDKWTVVCRFESDLETEFDAEVVRLDSHNSVDEDGRNSIKVYVPFASESPDSYRVGQSVIGKVNCGRRSLFFVWTRDIRDFLRSNFFWM